MRISSSQERGLTTLRLNRVGLAIGLGTLLTLLLPQPVEANSITFNPPDGNAPEETTGGASRGGCAASDAPAVQLLLPTDSSYGLTTADRPTLFAYVAPSQAPAVFFILKDEAGQVLHQETRSISTSGGILRFDLPDSFPALEEDNPYQWGLAVLCTGQLRPDTPVATGWIQRQSVASDLTQQLATGSLFDQAALYSANGFWYDTIATLVTLRQQQPTHPEVMTAWEQLLQAVGLETIADAPLLSEPSF